MKLGYNVVKEIFMMTAMKNQSKSPNSKRVLNLEGYDEKQTRLCGAIVVDALNELDKSISSLHLPLTMQGCCILFLISWSLHLVCIIY